MRARAMRGLGMSHWVRRRALRVVHLTVLVSALCVCASAQEGAAGGAGGAGAEQTLREILSELRLLRGAIQRTNLQTYRAQVTLGRIRVQQERVDRLARQLDSTRTELIGLRHGRETLAERVRVMEARVKAEADDESRAQWENVLRDLQAELRLQAEKEQARGAAEAQLAAQLQAEQSALEALNNSLEQLERELEGGDAADPGRRARP